MKTLFKGDGDFRIDMKNKKHQAIIIIVVSCLLLAVAVGLILDLTGINNCPPLRDCQDMADLVYSSNHLSWNLIAKIMVLKYALWIVAFVGIAWIIHGVSLRLLA